MSVDCVGRKDGFIDGDDAFAKFYRVFKFLLTVKEPLRVVFFCSKVHCGP